MNLETTRLERMRRSALAVGAAVALLSAGGLQAQVKKTVLSDGVVKYETSGPAPQAPSFWTVFRGLFQVNPTKRPFEKSYAFLVGVSSYKNFDPQLPYVKTDIEELRSFLMGEAGFDTVYVALDDVVTTELVEDYMVNLLPKELGEMDRLFFYYSGHGADIGGNTGYMQFGKARLGVYSSNQYLAITRTQEWSKVIHAKHILFLLDSCESGLGFDAKAGSGNVDQDLLNTLSGNGSRFVITAGTAREKAFQVETSTNHGYSVFTHSFLEALRSTSGYKDKGFLVLDEVFAESKVRVGRFSSTSGQKMTPREWPLPRDDKDTGTFIFLNKDMGGVSLSSRAQEKLGIMAKGGGDKTGDIGAGIIEVVSSSGGRIVIDGKDMGYVQPSQTQEFLRQVAGKHQVQVQGGESKEVEVESGKIAYVSFGIESPIDKSGKTAVGVLELRSTLEEDGELYIDNFHIGHIEKYGLVVVADLIAGRHQCRIDSAIQVAKQDVLVEAGKTARTTVVPAPPTGLKATVQ